MAATLALRLRLFVQRRMGLRPTPEERAGGEAEAAGVARELADVVDAAKGREILSTYRATSRGKLRVLTARSGILE